MVNMQLANVIASNATQEPKQNATNLIITVNNSAAPAPDS